MGHIVNAAKTVSIEGYLASVGYPINHPGKNINAFWRGDKTASVSVNHNKQLWRDFGTGTGGDVISLVMTINKCDFHTACSILGGDSYPTPTFYNTNEVTGSRIEITNVYPIKKWVLKNYLQERWIKESTFHRINEVHYRIRGNDREFYAVGWKNNDGGYVLRNKQFKGCTSSGYTFTDNGASDKLCVFEGFCDCLTYDSVYPFTADYLTLNSTVNAKKVIDILERYNTIELYLDNDQAGDTATSFFQANNPQVKDMRSKYQGCNDLNEYWIKWNNEKKNKL